ncbi:MAG: hypothetical protein IKH84_07225 [Ottowia sp.]|nr:hypothetical protein [Ottowia sp.]
MKNPEFGAYLTVKSPEKSMQNCINTRLATLREAHANCLIESMDMGADTLAAMLERASAPISNEEFVQREHALWLAKWQRT